MQQPKTKMTFRFEPPKPKLKAIEQPVRQTRAPSASDEGADLYDVAASGDRIERFTEITMDVRNGVNTPGPLSGDWAEDSQDAAGTGHTEDGSENPVRPFVAWDSPYQDDIRALEEMIRMTERPQQPIDSASLFRKPTAMGTGKTKKVASTVASLEPAIDLSEIEASEALRTKSLTDTIAGTSVSAYESSSWYAKMREEQASGYGDEIDLERLPSSGGPSWGRVFVSVAAAIVTGALFGYLVLGLFTGEPLFPGKSSGDIPASGTNEPLPLQSAETFSKYPVSPSSPDVRSDEPKATVSGPEGSAKVDGKVKLAASPAYLLQFGKFQSKESMQEAVKQLKEKGYVYATDASDGYRVFAGVASSQDDAKRLAARLTGAELYVKPFGSQEIDVPANNLPSSGAAYLNASAVFTLRLITFTQDALMAEDAGKPDQDTAESLAEAERLWRQTSSAADKFGDGLVAEAKAIAQALNAASLTLSDYAREPSRARLWSVQAQAMKALLADHRVRAALTATE
ncbi:SPOR domain-containing protein [Cohnella soli]|uniref:SPOR domain-containing protein n=1 Tax=Cohnella soli TaxID=425005 RepID=A0ABW0HNY2_9BACL